jgi:hypothetical protein
VAKYGGVFSFGDANFEGSVPGIGVNVDDIVGMAALGTGGYQLIASDGTLYTFNSSRESTSAPLSPPVDDIVGGAAKSDGQGTFLAGANGQVYLIGSGPLYGSAANLKLNATIVGIAIDSATGGYWLVGKDGGVFSFDAPFYGSTGSLNLNKPVVGMIDTPDGQGYWFAATDGGSSVPAMHNSRMWRSLSVGARAEHGVTDAVLETEAGHRCDREERVRAWSPR